MTANWQGVQAPPLNPPLKASTLAKLQIRIDDDIKENWLLKAKEQGTTLTELIITAVDGTKVKRRKRVNVDPALIRQLARLGNNLNQIAKWANRYKADANALAIIAELINIDREIAGITRVIEAKNAD